MGKMKQDRRVLRTKLAIRQAFIVLLDQLDISQITITDICNEANINRKTFYNHYLNIHELIEEIEEAMVLAFEQFLSKYMVNDLLANPEIFFDGLNHIIDENYEFYSQLILNKHSFRLVDKIGESFKRRLRSYLEDSGLVDKDSAVFIANYTVTGMLSMYQEVFKNRGIDKERLTVLFKIIVMDGFNGLIHHSLFNKTVSLGEL